MKELTFSMIKPLAVKKDFIGPILADISKGGFKIVALKMQHLSKSQAEMFYEIHKDKAFYGDLVDFMSSGPVVAIVLEKDNAVHDYRKLIGNTNPQEAEQGTIRSKYARDVSHNAVHGSDSIENANKEIRFFFSEIEIHAI